MDESFTINEFCAAEKISRSFFYKLESQGKAPRTYSLGNARRISRAARDAWRAALQAETAA
jgi:predicted DNA-binding transcriptional regulator AlpA